MSLRTIIQDAPLDDATKHALLARIDNEGETEDIRIAARDALQGYIDSGFTKLGVHVDPNAPELKQATDTYNAALSDIEDEFETEMDNLDIDTSIATANANRDLDTLEVDSLKAGLAA